jgi:hypothetical protein
MTQPYHTHETEEGTLVKCYHKTKAVMLDAGFWIGTLVAFPLEHFIWEKLPVFRDITAWMGL